MKPLLTAFILALAVAGCRNADREYERGWYNACYYVIYKNNHQAELPSMGLMEYSEDHPEIDFINDKDSAFIKWDSLARIRQKEFDERVKHKQ